MTDLTVSDIFTKADPERWKQGLAGLESNPAFAGIASAIAGQTDLMGWPAAFREIAKSIPDLLRIDVGKVLIGGWKKSEELRRYSDPEKYAPDETILVELTRHSISSSHSPHLDIVIADTQVGRVEFELEMKISLEGAVLTIRDGKIWAVSVGSCTASGEFSCEGHSIVRKESEPFELPGTYKLTEPVRIAATPGADPDDTH